MIFHTSSLHLLLLGFRLPDGEEDSSDKDGPVSPVPLQRTKPISGAPLVPREPPPRQALMPRPAFRQDRPSDLDDARQRPDSSAPSAAANGDESRGLFFQSKRPSVKNREGTSNISTVASLLWILINLISLNIDDHKYVMWMHGWFGSNWFNRIQMNFMDSLNVNKRAKRVLILDPLLVTIGGIGPSVSPLAGF